MEILVAGGAGYIGSITSKKLVELGHNVTVVDSLEKGNRWAVDRKAVFMQGNLLDKQFVKDVFSKRFDGVIDFAGYIEVKESVDKPGRYFTNNAVSVLNLLDGMLLSKSNNLIFSSSAAVYGNAQKVPIPEDSEYVPTSPYGQSKLMVEQMLRWYPIRHIALRYFNVAGAMPDSSLGQFYHPEAHLIAIAIKKAVEGDEFKLFGTDYNTPDGTCVRDYIHVLDLAEAHILALQALWDNKEVHAAYNVGAGSGYSNKEVLGMIEHVSGLKMDIKEEGRRKGDPTKLIADNSLIKKELGFSPKYSDLETIVKTAYNWYLKSKDIKA